MNCVFVCICVCLFNGWQVTPSIFMHIHFMCIYAGIYQLVCSVIVHLGVFWFETGSIVAVASSTLGCFSQLHLFFMSIKLTLFQQGRSLRAL